MFLSCIMLRAVKEWNQTRLKRILESLESDNRLLLISNYKEIQEEWAADLCYNGMQIISIGMHSRLFSNNGIYRMDMFNIEEKGAFQINI